jgi:Xaa-Pro aminopeptidase
MVLLPHYRATPEKFSYPNGEKATLIDSGGRIKTGTTNDTNVWSGLGR